MLLISQVVRSFKIGTITFLTGIIVIAAIIAWTFLCEKNNNSNGLFDVADNMKQFNKDNFSNSVNIQSLNNRKFSASTTNNFSYTNKSFAR